MKIVSAKYVYDRLSEKNCSINAVISDSRTKTVHVPLKENNRHFRAIQTWVDAGNKIEDAD
jgi:hypothetical protein